MKAIFHIGHHKTGTTSLQAFLAINNHRLLKAGILSPWVEAQGAVWAQAQGLDDSDADPAFLPINIREPHNALAFRLLADALPDRNVPSYHRDLPHSRLMLTAIGTQVEMLMPEAVVLCSEVMSHFGPLRPQLISRLANSMGGADFHLHATLRRPDDHLVAWHGQQLRFGKRAKALSDPDNGVDLNDLHVDYRAAIEPWLERLPGASHSLRSYVETIEAGGSIADFAQQTGLKLPSGLAEVPRMNPGMPAALFGLLRAANTALPKSTTKLLADDLEMLAEGIEVPGAREIEFFGSRQRTKLATHFRPIHDWLSEQVDRPEFFADIDDMAETRPITEGAALRAVLDQITPDRIGDLPGPDLRAFVTEFRETYRPDPLD